MVSTVAEGGLGLVAGCADDGGKSNSNCVTSRTHVAPGNQFRTQGGVRYVLEFYVQTNRFLILRNCLTGLNLGNRTTNGWCEGD